MRVYPTAVEQVVQTATRTQWLAPAVGTLGLMLYNWWVAAWFEGILPTPNMMFSDLEVAGGPYEHTLSRLDLAAGALILIALLLAGTRGRRPEWLLMIGFALSAMAGALSPYSCPEALDHVCRMREWTFQLPAEHYGHILAGVAEFGFATAAIWMSRRRLHGGTGTWARVADTLWLMMLIDYPLIAVSYLSDHASAFVEPLFLLAFSARVGMALFEPPTEARD